MNVTTGNAITDGKEFRYWFVGRIEKWCRENNVPFDKERFDLRSTDDIEMKWGIYKKGEARSDWVSSSDMTGMSILIRGNSIITFREMNGQGDSKGVQLMKEGDYVIWREDVEHTWKMLEDSTFLTLRWRVS
jgi:hypothetical protein